MQRMSSAPAPFGPTTPEQAASWDDAWTRATDPALVTYDLDPGAAALDDRDRTLVLTHLRSGETLVAAASLELDPVDGTRSVPIGVATDGEVRWTLALEHHVARHGAGVPAALLDHIRNGHARR